MVLAAGSSHVRPDQRYAWRGSSLLISDVRGECGDADTLTGYYYQEARHLRRLELRINGDRPWRCSDASGASDEVHVVFAHPELTRFGGGGTDVSDDTTWKDDSGLAQRSLDLVLRHRTNLDGLDVRLTISNHDRKPAELALTFLLDADFADIQEAFSGHREQQATVVREPHEGGLTFSYRHAAMPLATHVIGVGRAVWRSAADRLETVVTIAPQQSLELGLVVRPADPSVPRPDRRDGELKQRHVQRWRDGLTRLETPGPNTAIKTIEQALEDIGSLATLHGSQDEWMSLQAGMPLYPALFGRDTITAGWQIPMFDQGAVIEASLTRLGRMQSNRFNEWTDEEPGRIPYQVRKGPLARLQLNPYAAYYADFASPLLFIIGLGHLHAWRGDKHLLERHWDTARRILDWARTLGDRDGDGYLEYLTRSPKGTKNQGWKDSGNAIVYEDGTPVPSPCGTCDLQGYWFSAQQQMAVMSWLMGERHNATELWRSAVDLRRRFSSDWWIEADECYALAQDPDKRLACSPSSNVGQCLATGIIDSEHVPRVVGRLFRPDLFSGWGVRTLSSKHPAYNPLAYHLGSVWPVENATIAFGLRRYGFDQRATELASAYFDLSAQYDRGRIPECVGGFPRADHPHPGAYPRANPLQTWNQSGFAMMLQALLGLQPVAPLDLLVVDPVLPPWLPELTLHDLRLAGARATVRFVRDSSGACHAEVVRKRGTFHLLHQPPIESLTAGVKDRFGALFESVLHH